MKIVIAGGIRTPFVRSWTSLQDTPPQELGRIAVEELLRRLNLDGEEIDDVIFGAVSQPAEASNISRVIALSAGIPASVPAYTISRNCASGFEALTSAYEKISTGNGSTIIVGGVESMSALPFYFSKDAQNKYIALQKAKTFSQKLRAAAKFRPRDFFAPVPAIQLGLSDPISGLNMGETAEILAKEIKISREEQDKFALRSHQLAGRAWKDGLFADEVMTIYPPPRYEAIRRDTGIRETTLESLAKLKPVFDRKFGSVTAGNSSQITDGAAALAVMREDKARALGIRPLGAVRAYAYAGLDPARMGLGPVFATEKVFKKSGMKLSDIGLIEINEAFAVQVLACEKVFSSEIFAKRYGLNGAIGEIDREKLNVKGGAIALGHPVGASGSRIVLTLLHEMKRRNVQFALATLCVGGGQGGALILERLGK